MLISGRGSNMASLIAAAAAPDYPAAIVLVLSNRPDAPGLARARDAGIATEVVEHTAYPDRERFDAALHATLREHGIALVCLAGFMRILSGGFVRAWAGRMINIHPSLLPAFKGLHPHRQALSAGARVHGCTVHYVVPELDSGPTIVQAAVPVLPGDTEESLTARVLAAEHRLYPEGLARAARGVAAAARAATPFPLAGPACRQEGGIAQR